MVWSRVAMLRIIRMIRAVVKGIHRSREKHTTEMVIEHILVGQLPLLNI